jgi:hypothetical protein
MDLLQNPERDWIEQGHFAPAALIKDGNLLFAARRRSIEDH